MSKTPTFEHYFPKSCIRAVCNFTKIALLRMCFCYFLMKKISMNRCCWYVLKNYLKLHTWLLWYFILKNVFIFEKWKVNSFITKTLIIEKIVYWFLVQINGLVWYNKDLRHHRAIYFEQNINNEASKMIS